jgi:hypothetical protein
MHPNLYFGPVEIDEGLVFGNNYDKPNHVDEKK